MARMGEEFPLECPACGGDIRLIALITEPGPIRKILTHLGEPLEPPPVSPARGPPTDWGEFVQVHFRPGILPSFTRRPARDRVLADLAERLRGRPRLAWLPAGALAALAIGAAVHEPLWKVAGSQFLLTDDGAIERTASRGLRDGCFVNASGHPDPEGAFIELAVPSFNDIRLRTISLPRRAVERSPAGRRLRIAAPPPARL
jgi:hypothetical protein